LVSGTATVDAVAFTHSHADHVLGIDDLRGINRLRGTALDAFASYATLSEVQRRFDYAFRPATPPASIGPRCRHPIAPGETVRMAGMPVQVFRQDHRVMDTLGFRIGRFAIRRMWSACRRKAWRRCWTSIPGWSVACSAGRIRSMPGSPRCWNGWTGCGHGGPC
jgi:hypothetical protein